jgi:hypothetical protein
MLAQKKTEPNVRSTVLKLELKRVKIVNLTCNLRRQMLLRTISYLFTTVLSPTAVLRGLLTKQSSKTADDLASFTQIKKKQ